MVTENIPLSETGVGIPQVFETTKERLGLKPVSRMNIELDIRQRR